jgi:predicted MFS family arabinose efflux permease
MEEPKQMQADLDKRYQTLVVLWFALLMSVAMYFIFSLIGPAINEQAGSKPNSILVITLMAVGFLLVIISFGVKSKLLRLSVEKQDTTLVQKSLVIACALCEVSALLGLMERFLIGYRYYYFLFLFAGVGIALHFPRRTQLQNASFRNQAPLK